MGTRKLARHGHRQIAMQPIDGLLAFPCRRAKDQAGRAALWCYRVRLGSESVFLLREGVIESRQAESKDSGVTCRRRFGAKVAEHNATCQTVDIAECQAFLGGRVANVRLRERRSCTMMLMCHETTAESSTERFEIEQYELHVVTYEVEAMSSAEAIRRVLDGDGDISNGSEYVGTCDQMGMSLEDSPKLAEDLRKLGVRHRGCMIPSIRSVRRREANEGR